MINVTSKTDLAMLTEAEFEALTARQINRLTPSQRRAYTIRWISSIGRQQALDVLPMYDETELRRVGIDRDTAGLLFLMEDFRSTFNPSDWDENGRRVYPAFQFERGTNGRIQPRKLVCRINVEIFEVDRYGTCLHAFGWWIDANAALDDDSPLAHLDATSEESLTRLATKYAQRPLRKPTRSKETKLVLAPETDLATLTEAEFVSLTYGHIMALTADQAGQLATRLIAGLELHRAPVMRQAGYSSQTPGLLSVRLTTNELVFPTFQFGAPNGSKNGKISLHTQCRMINVMVFKSKEARNHLAALYWWLRPDPGLIGPHGNTGIEPRNLLRRTLHTALTDRAYAFTGKR